MTENERKDYVCDLLDNLKEGVRWMDSIETIFNAVGITCKAIEPDPLLGFNLHLLFCHLQDKDLVAWWLNARDDEILYVDPRTGTVGTQKLISSPFWILPSFNRSQ